MQEPSTNAEIGKVIKSFDKLFDTYPYKNEFKKVISTGERVILRSSKHWFLSISENLKMKCFDELSTVKFCPKLNLKDTEETHMDL